MSYNIILLTDTSQYPSWLRGHGAHQLASTLRARGYSCLVLDFASALTFQSWQKICAKAIGSDTVLVGVSTTWLPYRVDGTSFTSYDKSDIDVVRAPSFVTDISTGNADRWFDLVRQINPKIKIVAGGPKIDFYTDVPFDHFFAGFSETQLIDFIEDEKRLWPRIINHDTSAQSLSWDFRTSSVQYLPIDQLEPQETLTLELTRGCRFKCAFCSFPLIGRKDFASTAKCADILYQELNDNYQQWGITNYHIGDDTFNDTTDKLRLLHSVTERLPFKINFTAYTRIDVIANNLEQIELLQDIGLVSTWMGIDSLHPQASKTIGKGMSADKIMSALEKAKGVWCNDVYIKVGYIAGLPHEDSKHIHDVVEWFLTGPVDAVMVNPLRLMRPGPYPNLVRSDMDKNYKRYGYDFADNEYIHWTKTDNTDINNYQQAIVLSNDLNKKIKKHGKRIMNDTLRFGFSDPRIYYKHLIDML